MGCPAVASQPAVGVTARDRTGVLEVVYEREGERLARNVQPLEVEPGRFTQRLVRGEIDFESYGTVVARCRVDQGPVLNVPYTMLAPPTT